jgi:hypothetical protein
MGAEYKITAAVEQELFSQHVDSLPYTRKFDAKRQSYALFSPKSAGTAFAYVMFREGVIYFTDVQTEPDAAAQVFRGLIDLGVFLRGPVVVEEA